MSGSKLYKDEVENINLTGYEKVIFFDDDCEIEFTAQFNDADESYNDPHISVIGSHDTIEITTMLTDDKQDDLYRKAMSERGK